MRPYFVSFHPEIRMEENLPVLGSIETAHVQELIGRAAGVVLPEYISPWRNRTITRMAKAWFPRLEARFTCQGKIRQVLLFRKLGIRHPESIVFKNRVHLLAFHRQWGSPWEYPVVLKGDIGGGGSTVFPIYRPEDMGTHVMKIPETHPVLLQRMVNHKGRDLRVVIYGDHAVSYFRVGGGSFYNNVCRGGKIDHDFLPEEQLRGIETVRAFCRRVQIDIAAFDLMFPDGGEPVFVEINFHFGRKGLGGTVVHRRYLQEAVQKWKYRQIEQWNVKQDGHSY